ncbi:MAG: efflux transporter outer membrane subunit [Pseudomonadota bacterium]|nr:efflux transporter outer membrane subunit [Pseudomonadota bacterium]
MRHVPSIALAALAACLTGCTVGPDYNAPVPGVPDTWSETVPGSETAAATAWWRGFGDEQLDTLITTALDENIDVRIAVARLAEAEARTTAERAANWPSVDASADASATGDISGDAASSTAAGLGAALAFVPDVFGGRRRQIEQVEATAAARRFDIEDVKRVTAASIAERYIELRRSRARLDLLTTSLELQQQTLDIVRQRAEAGLSADLDVQRAASDLARTRAQRGSLDIAEARSLHDLAILTGALPGTLGLEPAAETTIPDFADPVAPGVPADLLRRRADLQAAERDLAAASAAIGVATAELYPAFSIPGSITADLGSADRLVGDVVARIGAAVDVPVFDAGRRRAGVDIAEARAEQALLTYRQTLLEAVGEVEDALVSIRAVEARTAELERAVAASEQAFDQLDALYREGLASFIDILDAQRTLIDSRESLLDSQADHALAVIALHRALGAPVDPALNPGGGPDSRS